MRPTPSSPDSPETPWLVPTGLAVAWIALLGADRVDLLGGSGGFLLTPFLALTPLLLGLAVLRVVSFRVPFPLSQRVRGYLALAFLLLTVAALSALLSRDVETSLRRTLLLSIQIVGTAGVGLAVLAGPRPGRILARGAAWGLILAVGFNVAQSWIFLTGSPPLVDAGPATVDLAAWTYAGIVPRLSGQVADPNRAGLVFLLYAFFVARWGGEGVGRTWLLVLSVVLMVLTLSRSNLLAVGVAAGVALILDRAVRVRPGLLLAGSLAIALGAGFLLSDARGREEVGRSLAPLSGRFTLEEGSTRDHLRLLDRGVEEATSSVRRAALGVGYGNSFHLLQDVFPGNEYGNFHSLYVSVFAESGIVALLLVLALLAVPLVLPGPFRPLVAGIVVFNVFYQSSTEPAFWLALSLAWATVGLVPAAVSVGLGKEIVA